MNINIVRLSPVVAELKAVRLQLTRIADVLEAEAVERGTITRPIPRESPRSSDPPTIGYTDEARDYVLENSPAEQARQREFIAQMLAEDEEEKA